MKIEQEMWNRVTEFIQKRYPEDWGGAAIIHTEEGSYFISVSIDTANDAVSLCMETGAICEAHKYNEKVTHCLCVVREDEESDFQVLSPCGVCQERLRFWGTDVKVGVTTPDGSLRFVTLGELQPYHWTNAYPADELEQFEKLDLDLK